MLYYYIKLILIWLIFFVLHSFFAAEPVKNRIKSRLGKRSMYYRMYYVIGSGFLLMFIVYYLITGTVQYLFKPVPVTTYAGLMLAAAGVIIFNKSFKIYSGKEFLGLSYLGTGDGEEVHLRTDGILSHIRHPLYAGSILLLSGYFLFSPSITNLINLTVISLYFLVGIRFEEQKLINHFGERYIQYRRNVPMLIPRRIFGRKQ